MFELLAFAVPKMQTNFLNSSEYITSQIGTTFLWKGLQIPAFIPITILGGGKGTNLLPG